jgi:cysteine desulfurase
MRVYLDNAATTPLDKEVLEAMLPYMTEHFGNPSSIHGHGNKVRAGIEQSRKKIATLLNTSPAEIFFTSGGTESDNTAIRCAIDTYNLTHAITSPIEHHAVEHTLADLANNGKIKLSFVKLDEKGNVDLDHLRELLATHPRSLVSLMHANNEIGNLLDIEAVGNLCEEFNAYFHSDTVQTVGHFPINLQKIKVHSINGAAHKFHGPKGIGFIYIKNEAKICPLITGGSQERNMRGGTENVYGIIGLAKALEIACREMEEHKRHILNLKAYMIERLKDTFQDIRFNGESANLDKSLYTVLNVSLPPSPDNDMLLFNLDIRKISASGGSACSSGSEVGSHVLKAIKADPNRANVRFSFSKYNTKEEIDYVIEQLAEIYNLSSVEAVPSR